MPKLNAPVLVVLPKALVAGAAPKGLAAGAAPNGEGFAAAAPPAVAPPKLNEKPPDAGAGAADPDGAPAAGVAGLAEPNENPVLGALLAAVAGAAEDAKLNIGLAASAGLSVELVPAAALLAAPAPKVEVPAAAVLPKVFFAAPKGFEAPALLVAPNTLPLGLLPFVVPKADAAPPAGLPNALVVEPGPLNGLGLVDVLPPNELGFALAVLPPNGLEVAVVVFAAGNAEVVAPPVDPKLKVGFACAAASFAGSAAAGVVEAPLLPIAEEVLPNAEGVLLLVVLKLNLGAAVVSLAGSVEVVVEEGPPNGEGAELLAVLKLNLGAVGLTPG